MTAAAGLYTFILQTILLQMTDDFAFVLLNKAKNL